MKRSFVVTGISLVALLALTGCAGPGVALAPEAGGKELNFEGFGKGAKANIKIEVPANAPNIPAVLGGHFIEEGGEKKEGNFKIVAGGTCGIPGQKLNRGEACTVSVEFASGKAGQKATYVLEYGTAINPKMLKATLPIKS